MLERGWVKWRVGKMTLSVGVKGKVEPTRDMAVSDRKRRRIEHADEPIIVGA